MLAAWDNLNPEVITILLKAGAKADNRDKNGVTALMTAAKNNQNPEIIKVLLKAGANPKLKSIAGKTAFDYAEENEKVKGTQTYLELKKVTL